MITKQRIQTAISKVGRPKGPEDQARIAEVTEEVIRDVKEEIESRYGALLLALYDEEVELLWSVVEDTILRELHSGMEWKPADTSDGLDPKRYYVDLAQAFIRGRLSRMGDETSKISEKNTRALLYAARGAELRWHKFKRKSGPPRVARVLSILEGIRPETLLDIGPGRGAFLWPLVAHFSQIPVCAIDITSIRIRDIVAVRTGGIDRITGILGSVTDLPFDNRAFDVVTLLEVLEHLRDPGSAACEALRVARRFVVASVPSHEDDNPEHIRLFDEKSLNQLFLEVGAKRVDITYVLNHMIAVVKVRNANE